jgi:hydrogenase maturation protease
VTRTLAAAPPAVRPGEAGPARPPILVVGLGGAVMGDDAIGLLLAADLAADPAIDGLVEVVQAGTDLLAVADRFRGRRRVLLVDAIEPGPAQRTGEAALLDPLGAAADELDPRSGGAHALSVPGCLRLLAAVDDGIEAVEVRLFAVAVRSCRAGEPPSPELAARRAELVEELRARCLEAVPWVPLGSRAGST